MSDTKLLKATGDVDGDWIVDEELSDGRLVIRPDTSAAAIRRRTGLEQISSDEFAEHFGHLPIDHEAPTEHPGIQFVDGPAGRRPAVTGGPDVWEIVMVAKDNAGSPEQTAAYLEIDPRLAATALRYYGAHREEIDAWIARMDELNERAEDEWRAAQGPLPAAPIDLACE